MIDLEGRDRVYVVTPEQFITKIKDDRESTVEVAMASNSHHHDDETGCDDVSVIDVKCDE